ncbi:hypothetical protein VQ042_09250 [Aurantimonas sp. A2-1-M11]|uniref:hypothetical protein n=1 Tax=Aurantimonas sp. A2-1-M11 TaxID=3113712 RepID=UPI002F9530ED
MRTIIALAIEEIPVDMRARIAMKRPAVSWQDYDEARRPTTLVVLRFHSVFDVDLFALFLVSARGQPHTGHESESDDGRGSNIHWSASGDGHLR